MSKGLVLGRFQPFHLEHLRLVKAAAAASPDLRIGVTMPFGDIGLEPRAVRTEAEANPLPYWLREQQIQEALIVERIQAGIIPLPLNPTVMNATVHPATTVYTTLIEPWSAEKRDLIRGAGLQVTVLDLGTRTISGSKIRSLIRDGSADWRALIPRCSDETAAAIEDHVTGREGVRPHQA